MIFDIFLLDMCKTFVIVPAKSKLTTVGPILVSFTTFIGNFDDKVCSYWIFKIWKFCYLVFYF